MKQLNSWFSIDEHEYLMYLLKGYDIRVEDWFVEWRFNGKVHREDGPAHISHTGCSSWFLNGRRHRTDGPAITWEDGSREWFVNNRNYSEYEFNEKIKQLV